MQRHSLHKRKDKKRKNIPEKEAFKHIFGYIVFNDITARKIQLKAIREGSPWYLSKSIDTFGSIGPRIVLAEDIGNPHDLSLELKVNGEIKQSSNAKHMIFKIPYLIEYISSFITLEKDDIIATGTPAGISALVPGDEVEATIQGIGTLRNKIILEQ